jgi:hypothetical protein
MSTQIEQATRRIGLTLEVGESFDVFHELSDALSQRLVSPNVLIRSVEGQLVKKGLLHVRLDVAGRSQWWGVSFVDPNGRTYPVLGLIQRDALPFEMMLDIDRRIGLRNWTAGI